MQVDFTSAPVSEWVRTDLGGGHYTNDGKLFWSSVAEFRNVLTLHNLTVINTDGHTCFATMQNRLTVICTEEISLTVYPLSK